MAASRGTVRSRHPPARPVPGAMWQAHVLDATAVQAELDKMWSTFGDHHGADPSLPDESRPWDHVESVSVQMRATTFNLIAVARRREDARRIEDAILRLGDLYPSRATILIADPSSSPASDTGLDVQVSLVEQPASKDRPAIRFESVIVDASGVEDRNLASIASPLLVVDLPDFLWWPGDGLTGSELFDDLVEVTDRLIVDTAMLSDPAAGLRGLAERVSRVQGFPNLSDLAWARLAPWRQLIAQFFDPGATQTYLDQLQEVSMTYAAANSGLSGFSGALLTAGWLASRLGWRAPGEVVSMPGADGGWRVTLRAGSRQHLREVVLVLRPTSDPIAAGGLASLTLSTGSASSASFRIERVDALGLWTRSETPMMPPVSRMVYAAPANYAGLLADELRVFGRSQVYEQALAFAAILAPSESDGTSAG